MPGQEANLTNQMGQTVLHHDISLTGIFVIGPVIITADDTPKGLTENLLEYRAASGKLFARLSFLHLICR